MHMALYHMHRDKRSYGDDAHEFRPERWDTVKPDWSFAPFGGGPRVCIGRELRFSFSFDREAHDG